MIHLIICGVLDQDVTMDQRFVAACQPPPGAGWFVVFYIYHFSVSQPIINIGFSLILNSVNIK
jgi:hypothetical protein